MKIQRRKLSHGGLKTPEKQTQRQTAVGSGDLLGHTADLRVTKEEIQYDGNGFRTAVRMTLNDGDVVRMGTWKN